MVLGMVEDVRVVLIRLASRTQTLRWFSKNPSEDRVSYARETLDIYAPLANRLGVWQLKWELEDLSFRYLEPELYKRIAQMLDEKRLEREQYIRKAMQVLAQELGDIKAEITGRPKHIYSIWNKMRAKQLDFSEVYDVRALRVIVPELKDCYTALGVVHNLWQPIPKEFDDYISRPKGNLYQSLHTAVLGPGGKTLEVQIRTEEMHRHAEYGVAAHWQYKEKAKASKQFEQKVAWLRQLLAWRDEVPVKKPQLDETIYVLTPQGKSDRPAGGRDADRLRLRAAQRPRPPLPRRARRRAHREARYAARERPARRDRRREERRPVARLAQPRARLRQERALAAQDPAVVQRPGDGRRRSPLDARWWRRSCAARARNAAPASRRARDEARVWQARRAVCGGCARRGQSAPAAGRFEGCRVPPQSRRSRKAKKPSTAKAAMLVVGMGGLATQLARCCKPVPPDPIRGFVTRGKGVSIHREGCESLKRLAERQPERVMETEWGKSDATYAVDMAVTAADRRGLLRDIGDALAREKINVTAVRTQNRDDLAFMRFTFDVADAGQLKRALALVRGLKGVIRVARG